MINNSGHLRDYYNENGICDTSRELIVNCCGYQHLLTKNVSNSYPNGRRDYKITYLCHGIGYFLVDGKWLKKRAGDIHLYRPNEPQIYHYFSKDHTQLYWIHFTGSHCEEILTDYQISSFHVGDDILLKNLFQQLIVELQLKKPLYEHLSTHAFHQLLITLNRHSLSHNMPSNSSFALDRLILELNQRYQDRWSLNDMAAFCHLSPDYLSHLFRSTYQISPLQYLTRLRLDKAKEFLSDDHISVSEAAYLSGFLDPLYFSRVFHKKIGLSPKAYQKQIKMTATCKIK